MTRLRKLTDAGIIFFREYLNRLRLGATEEIPGDLLTGEELSSSLDLSVVIEAVKFDSKFEAARYLYPKIQLLKGDSLFNVGLWSWLSVFYFDSVCPAEKEGRRKPGADHRHILIAGRDWRHSYRHLLAGPVRRYAFHEPGGRILLGGPVNKLDDFVEQLSSRQDFATNRGIIAAATSLYWDDVKKKPRRGAAPNRRNPGTLRRYIDVIQQFELTYDLYSMTGPEIVELLPGEFDAWKQA